MYSELCGAAGALAGAMLIRYSQIASGSNRRLV